MKKADYSKIAATYDKGRHLLDQNASLWMDIISRLSKASAGAQALDLGCGTGRFSLPMVEQLGYDVTGVDSSQEMLDWARSKDSESNIHWVCQNADAMAFHESSFDLVFLSHLLHHVDNPLKVLQGCHHALKHGSAILIRYGAIEDIREDPEHIFFPGVSEIDEPRTPSVTGVESWLKEAGFGGVVSETISQKTYETPMHRLESAAAKSTSVLSMIKGEEFQEGLRRMKLYIQQNPDDLWLTFDRITLTVGYKPA